MVHAIDKVPERFWENLCISIDLRNPYKPQLKANIQVKITYHQADLKKIGSYAHESMNFAEKIEIKGRHSVIVGHTRKEIHENELTITLSSVTGFLVRDCLGFGSTFHNNHSWRTTSCNS